MNNKSIRSIAKSKLSPNWGAAVGIMVIMAVVRGLATGIQTAMMPEVSTEAIMMAMAGGDPYMAVDQIQDLSSGSGLSSLVGIVFSIIMTIMATGISWGYVDMVDRGDLQFESITWAFPRFGEIILLYLWTGLWTVLWALPVITAMGILTGGIIMESDPVIIGSLLAFLVTLVLYISRIIRYSQALLVLYDNPKMGARAALRESIEQMRGKVGQYILLMLSYYLPLIILSTLFAVFVGFGVVGFGEAMTTSGVSGNSTMVIGIVGSIGSFIMLIILSFMLAPRIASGQAVFYTELIRRDGFTAKEEDFSDDPDQAY